MELTLTGISQDTREATITMWCKNEGEKVVKGRDLVEIVTDKATFDVPAPCSGTLTKINKKAGEMVTTDEVIAVILEDE
jgi:pyruvate/2-oxoglutarate dehydrogenase complex dihydrolipoamide acyltransferase (E2) component